MGSSRSRFALCVYVFLLAAFSAAARCEHYDWSASCPEGWAEVDDGTCMAGLSYAGSCRTKLSVGSEDVKRQVASACRVDWPCLDQCQQDFDLACPMSWLDRGDAVCDAPLRYNGPCLASARMVDAQFKEDFAARCGVRWACQKSCEEDFDALCPSDWELIGGMCVASSVYTGPCAPFQNLVQFDQREKRNFAAACEVDFCRSGAAASKLEKERCGPSQTQLCPDGWLRIGSSIDYCFGPIYAGPCRPLISVDELEKIGKEIYMTTCAVSYPCEAEKGRTRANLDSPVPGSEEMAAPSGPIRDDGRLRVVNRA